MKIKPLIWRLKRIVIRKAQEREHKRIINESIGRVPKEDRAGINIADIGMAAYLKQFGSSIKDKYAYFEEETGKKSFWGGKETKQFKKWLNKR